ncbi:MAG: alpha/beta fold hydrolase [Candidatus Hydrogenedens sp.]|nr:alpha/beta fold hydrolase [Candidatus Hydrogenedens sp.]
MLRKRRTYIALAVFLLVGYSAQGNLSGYLGYEDEGEYFFADGVKLHYLDEGAGEPVILLHGYGMNMEITWRQPGAFDALVGDGFRAIALDMRGHGYSAKPYAEERYGTEMVEDVVRLMDHLGIEKAHIAGNSLGALVGIKMLELHPDRMRSLIACGMGYMRYEGEAKQAAENLTASLARGGGFEPLIRYLQPPDEPIGWMEVSAGDALVRMWNDEHALLEMTRAMPQLEPDPAALRRTDVPVLNLIGAKDPLIENVDKLGALVPDHQKVVIEGASHFTLIGSPGTIDTMLEFLEAHRTDALPPMA